MGRSNIQRKRFSHISVTLEVKAKEHVKPKTIKKRKEA
jgi:hypothetical protein